jgi:hypothetical protein
MHPLVVDIEAEAAPNLPCERRAGIDAVRDALNTIIEIP